MTSTEKAELRALITRHEGYRRFPYQCSSGKITIGVGRNLEDVGIDEEEARYLLDRDIARAYVDLASSFSWFELLDRVRQRALVDMRFQLGGTGLRGFAGMLDALAVGDFDTAAEECLDSRYARQTPARAGEIARMLRTGVA